MPNVNRPIFLVFALAAVLAAQMSTADVVGTVTDQSGAVVPAANIKVTNLATGLDYAAVADKDVIPCS